MTKGTIFNNFVFVTWFSRKLFVLLLTEKLQSTEYCLGQFFDRVFKSCDPAIGNLIVPVGPKVASLIRFRDSQIDFLQTPAK